MLIMRDRTGAERQDSTLEMLGLRAARSRVGKLYHGTLMALAQRGVDAFSVDFQDLKRELDRD